MDPALVEEGDFTEAGGMRAMAALLERAPALDAVLAASDPMAVGVLAALRAACRRVPDDVAVVGFDDAPVAADCDPPLTTVAQPLAEMTRSMTALLREQIESRDGALHVEIWPTELIRRGSA